MERAKLTCPACVSPYVIITRYHSPRTKEPTDSADIECNTCGKKWSSLVNSITFSFNNKYEKPQKRNL